MGENRGKVSFSLRWTFVNMVVTVCGIAVLAVYMGLSKKIEWCWYALTLLMVMCIAMVWMVPLMVASKYPGNILSVMYQRGVLDLRYPARQFLLKWQKEDEKERWWLTEQEVCLKINCSENLKENSTQ